MNILFITDNFPPEVNAPATRTYEHIKEWIKDKDIKVTVLTCFPNFPTGKVYDGYKNRLYRKDSIEDIEIIRVWSYIVQNKGFVKRVVDYLSFGISSFIVGLFLKYDIIIATSPQFFTTWSAWGLSKARRKPWIFELRDLWPKSIKAVGAIKNKKIIKFLEKIEIKLYKDSDMVVSVTSSLKKDLVDRGIQKDKVKIIYNGANLELFKPKERDKELLKKLSLKDGFIVGYIGTHGLAHGLDFILNSIVDLKEDIHFLFIGDGAKKEELVAMAKKLNLSNVTFLHAIKKEDVPKYFSMIDISLVPLTKNDIFKTAIPSKIFESCAMQKPVLLGVEGEAKDIITRYGAGVCFEPENREDFIEKLLFIKENYEDLLDGCRQLSKDFDRKKSAHDMLSIIKKILQDKNGT